MKSVKYFLVSLFTSLLLFNDASSQAPVLLKDINLHDAPAQRSPYQFIETDGVIYFIGEDRTHGRELFSYDPQTGEVSLVKDLYPGGENSSISNLFIYKDTLYFSAFNEVFGGELFTTDGTAEGTVPVTSHDFYVGSVSEVVFMDGLIYMSASWDNLGSELYVSDGTGEETTLIRDIYPGLTGSEPRHLTIFDNEIYFVGRASSSGQELWKSDGTADGTVLVKDIVPGNGSPSIFQLGVLGEYLYFNADTDASGSELWRTDGTAEGTELFVDINPGPGNSYPNDFVVTDTVIYFSAGNEQGQGGLWKTNGTVEGTMEIKTINASTFPSHGAIYDMVFIDSLLYFRASDGIVGQELWISDGTSDGTFPIDLEDGSGSSSPREFTKSGDMVYFQAKTQSSGFELWRTDGTPGGTELLELAPGEASSSPTNLFAHNDTLYMNAFQTLYKSDGTVAGTIPVDPLEGTESSMLNEDDQYPFLLGGANNLFFFQANDGIHYFELWKSDGTPEGTGMVEDIFTNEDTYLNERPRILNAIEGDSLLYFVANHPYYGVELWKSDGTEGGTSIVKDINPGAAGGVQNYFAVTNAGAKLLFFANDGVNGLEIWSSDGTSDGTNMVTQLVEGAGGISLFTIPVAGLGKMFFSLYTAENGMEPWVTDGTESGTMLLKDINPGAGNSQVSGHCFWQDSVYFWANDGSAGAQLWKSDGTSEGTEKMSDFPTVSAYSSQPSAIVRIGSSLYFSYDDAVRRSELHKYNLNTNELSLVRDINSPGESAPRELTVLNDQIIFIARTNSEGDELWASDGTSEGTRLLKDIVPGPRYSNVNNLMVAAGKGWFIADDPDQGSVLWQTDGTSEGTVPVEGSPVNVTEINAYNGVLYLIAGNQEYGFEPYKYDIKQEQFITFDPMEEKQYGDVPFMLNGTSTAGLSVDYTSSQPTVATVEGGMVTIHNAGETTITAAQPGNEVYVSAAEQEQNLVVRKADLSVTAQDVTRGEGEENPEFELIYDGFVYDDDPDDLDETPVAATSADAESPAGSYDINVTGGADKNYSFTYSNGVLTVTEITGTGDTPKKAFNIYPNPASSFLYIGTQDVETVSYRIMDITGTIHHEGETLDGQIRLDALEPGSYVLILEDSDRYMIVIE